MTHPRPRPETRPHSLAFHAAHNVRRLRDGESAAALAGRAATEGVALNRSTLANIENLRREDLTLDEVAALCIALNVSPVDLLCPPGDAPVRVTPEREDPAPFVRSWLRGEARLPSAGGGGDLRLLREFWDKAPDHERREHDERLWHHPLLMALVELRVYARDGILGPEDAATRKRPKLLAQQVRRTAEKVSHYAELLAQEIEEKGWA